MAYKILILPGDGIGPEVMKEVDKVSSVVSKNMQNAVKLDVPLYVNTKINSSLANFNN